nr:MAG TPA: hypothetical protein [Ackermannviridae sp.]
MNSIAKQSPGRISRRGFLCTFPKVCTKVCISN